jgi:hypothetical protein
MFVRWQVPVVFDQPARELTTNPARDWCAFSRSIEEQQMTLVPFTFSNGVSGELDPLTFAVFGTLPLPIELQETPETNEQKMELAWFVIYRVPGRSHLSWEHRGDHVDFIADVFDILMERQEQSDPD